MSNELMWFAGVALTALLAQRTQNNSLAKRLEDGILKRLDTQERRLDNHDDALDDVRLKVNTLETVCKLRQTPREGGLYQSI